MLLILTPHNCTVTCSEPEEGGSIIIEVIPSQVTVHLPIHLLIQPNVWIYEILFV